MSAGLVFKTLGEKRLKLDAAVLERFAIHRQLAPHHHEAGGVLLGRHLLGSADVVVDEITEPMPGDARSRFQFRRQQQSHQRRIDEAWRASRGTCVYLGEWHTHPEPNPTPSGTDLRDWERHLRVDIVDGDTLYFVIVGTRAVRAWEGVRARRSIRPMELVG